MRVIDQKSVMDIIVEALKKSLADIQGRSAEAVKALEQRDFLVALGAISGLESQLRDITVRLMVLRELEQILKSKQK